MTVDHELIDLIIAQNNSPADRQRLVDAIAERLEKIQAFIVRYDAAQAARESEGTP